MPRKPEDPPLRYRKHVFVCMNERCADDPRGCCAAKGSPALRDYMKQRAKELGLGDIRINQAGCLDVCEAGPALVVYPEGVWYHVETKRDVDEILLVHLRDNGRVPRLMLDRNEKRRLKDPSMHEDTIFALGSGQARAGIAVIRISGSRAGEALQRLSGAALPRPRQATRVRLCDPETGEALDSGLALWFPAPKSFTGEAVAELHLHGGRACVEGVLAALSRLSGLRPADPGEFTRRAFENGKLDLTEVEGLADLIQAETAAQRRQALRQFEGALGERYENWREALLQALARMEAAIDFVDEELPKDVIARAGETVAKISAEIRAHLDDNRRGERLREGFRIVLLGAPNAGKSTLLNAIARREAAIVSEEPGTTRDVVEVGLDLGGFPVVLADTAGLRESKAAVEREGVRRARARAAESDLKITLFDGKIWPECDPETRALVDENTLPVITKADLHKKIENPRIGDVAAISISAKTGEGMEMLLERLEEAIRARLTGSETAPLTRLRHRRHLEECLGALERFPKAVGAELAAEDLRLAVRALGRITGRVDVEEILDRLFAEFCIGK